MIDVCGAHVLAHPRPARALSCLVLLSELSIMVATTNSKLLASPETEVLRHYLVLNSILSSLPVSQLQDWDNEGRGFIRRSVYSTAIAHLTWQNRLALVTFSYVSRIPLMHAQIVCDVKGDILPTIRLPGIRSSYSSLVLYVWGTRFIPLWCSSHWANVRRQLQ